MEKIEKIIKNAYAPYSNYPVAAKVLMRDGKEYYGVNVENASYGATICAERNAINNAITMGYKKGDFVSLTVMVEGSNFAFPCFLCRQTIVEFFEPTCDLVLVLNGVSKYYKMRDIIVHPFTKKDLLWKQDLLQ